jgi:hypothetical protein
MKPSGAHALFVMDDDAAVRAAITHKCCAPVRLARTVSCISFGNGFLVVSSSVTTYPPPE